jgi:hypothetical protein
MDFEEFIERYAMTCEYFFVIFDYVLECVAIRRRRIDNAILHRVDIDSTPTLSPIRVMRDLRRQDPRRRLTCSSSRCSATTTVTLFSLTTMIS